MKKVIIIAVLFFIGVLFGGAFVLNRSSPSRNSSLFLDYPNCTVKIPEEPPKEMGRNILGHSVHFSMSSGYVSSGSEVSAYLKDPSGKYYFLFVVYENTSDGWKIIANKAGTEPKVVLPDKSGKSYVLVIYAVEQESCKIIDHALSVVVTVGKNFKAEMRLDKEKYHAGENAKLTVINKGDVPIVLGIPYGLYRYENGSWRRVPLGLVFTMQAFIIMPGESWSQNIRLVKAKESATSSIIGDPANLEPLPPGRYKLVKDVWPEPGGIEKREYLEVEFEVID